MSSSDSRRDGLRRPRALASAATLRARRALRPEPSTAMAARPLLAAGGERQQPWLTRWPRVARESTVRLATRSRVPQAHWLGGPATLVGRRGPPWPARAARPGQYAWGRRATLVRATQPPWLGHTSRTGSSARARLGGGHPGWLATYGRWPYTYTLFLLANVSATYFPSTYGSLPSSSSYIQASSTGPRAAPAAAAAAAAVALSYLALAAGEVLRSFEAHPGESSGHMRDVRPTKGKRHGR